jgi:hypothetical protein
MGAAYFGRGFEPPNRAEFSASHLGAMARYVARIQSMQRPAGYPTCLPDLDLLAGGRSASWVSCTLAIRGATRPATEYATTCDDRKVSSLMGNLHTE